MKLQANNHGFESMLPSNRVKMTIQTSAVMFDILSSGIYKDKILAVIREYCCNAYDAHVSVGKEDVPFKIVLPTKLNPTFSVTDYGPGIHPDMISSIYWTYGKSSKTEDQNSIGALGLGSKSGFAYTKSSFVVKNRFNGMIYNYFCFIDESGEPAGTLLSAEPTEEPSGITVEFAVRNNDIDSFYDRTKRFFKNWNHVFPKVSGDDNKIFNYNDVKLLEGKNWHLIKQPQNSESKFTAVAVMGGVTYPIDYLSIPNLPEKLRSITNSQFVIYFELGDLEFASSREELSYTEFTCKALKDRMEDIYNSIRSIFAEKLSGSQNLIEFISNTVDLTTSIRKSITGASKSNVFFCDNDEITFKGETYSFTEILNGVGKITINGKSKFGLFTRIGNRFFNVTKLYAKTSPEGASSNDETVKRIDIVLEWKKGYRYIDDPANKTQRCINLINDRSSFITLKTECSFNITKTLTVYVNDLGTVGRARFMHLESNSYLVDFDNKSFKLDDILAELKESFKKYTGTKIVLLSTAPDRRPVIEREKIAKNNIKVGVIPLSTHDKNISSIDFGSESINVARKIKSVSVNYQQTLILDVEELKKEPQLYVSKRRGKTLYDRWGSDEKAILGSNKALQALFYLKMLDPYFKTFTDSEYEKLNHTYSYFSNKVSTYDRANVLVLSDGQYEWLKKRGVKLVPFSELTDPIIKLNDVEKYHEQCNERNKVFEINSLQTFHSKVTRLFSYRFVRSRHEPMLFSHINPNGTFGTYLKTYYDMIDSDHSMHFDMYVKNYLYIFIKGTDDDLIDEHDPIQEKYSIFELVNQNPSLFNTDTRLKLVLDFINLVDGHVPQDSSLFKKPQQKAVVVEEIEEIEEDFE